MKVAGISYDINWRAFTKGTSLFFPCLYPEAAKRELKPEFRRHRLKVVYKTCVDPKSGIRGLRVWRM